MTDDGGDLDAKERWLPSERQRQNRRSDADSGGPLPRGERAQRVDDQYSEGN